MKRSQMIENIANILKLSGNHYCDDGRDMQDADKILKRLENLGMLPPFDENIEESKVGYGAAYLSDEEVRLRYIRHFCKWELEDE